MAMQDVVRNSLPQAQTVNRRASAGNFIHNILPVSKKLYTEMNK